MQNESLIEKNKRLQDQQQRTKSDRKKETQLKKTDRLKKARTRKKKIKKNETSAERLENRKKRNQEYCNRIARIEKARKCIAISPFLMSVPIEEFNNDYNVELFACGPREECAACGSNNWELEKQNEEKNNLIFSICCNRGQTVIPDLPPVHRIHGCRRRQRLVQR